MCRLNLVYVAYLLIIVTNYYARRKYISYLLRVLLILDFQAN